MAGVVDDILVQVEAGFVVEDVMGFVEEIQILVDFMGLHDEKERMAILWETN